jgi:hypothetical protein
MPDNSIIPLNKMTAARQTMQSWARLVETLDEVPEVYRISYRALAGENEPLPYTVFAPPQGGPKGKTNEWLVWELDGTFNVLEHLDGQILHSVFRYEDITSLEQGNILLYSWFTITGRTITGTDATITVKFNEATLRHFEPFFRAMRPTPEATLPDARSQEQSKFDLLAKENYKFMSLARASLLPGERVIQTLYQPEIREKVPGILGRNTHRTRFQAHLIVLTDSEMVLIADAERIAGKKKSKYGGVHNFLPLRSLSAGLVEEQPDGLLKVIFQVIPDIRFERFLEPSKLPEVKHLITLLEALPHHSGA